MLNSVEKISAVAEALVSFDKDLSAAVQLNGNANALDAIYETAGIMSFIAYKQGAEEAIRILGERGFEIVESGVSRTPASPWRSIESAPDEEVILYFPPVISSGGHVDNRAMKRLGRVSDFPNRKPSLWMPIPPVPEDGKA